MAKRKTVPLPTPVVDDKDDKLARFRITEDTVSVKYAGRIWRVRKQTPKLIAISRGNGQHEEFLWIYRDVASEIPPKRTKSPAKKSAKPSAKKAAAKPKDKPAKVARKAATPKKVAKKPITKRGSVRRKK